MAEKNISYGIGLSDQMINQMLQSDDPTIVAEAEKYIKAAQEQQPKKSGILQKIGNFFFAPAAGAEPDFNVITGEPKLTTNQFPFESMVDMAAKNELALNEMFSTPSDPFQYSRGPQPVNVSGIPAAGNLVGFTDDAGLEEEYYEDFPQKFNPGFNMDFAKQLGSGVLGLVTNNPLAGLVAKGLGYLGDKFSLPGVVGGADLRGDTGFDTFRRSTSLADFFQRRRDQQAREEAAATGLAKQQRQAGLAALSNVYSNVGQTRDRDNDRGGNNQGGGFSGGPQGGSLGSSLHG